MSISKQTIIDSFKRFLGREPESEDVIRAHQVFTTEEQLADALANSQEYLQRIEPVAQTPRKSRFKRAVKVPAHVSTSTLRVTIFGNCSALTLAKLMQAMTGDIVATAVEATSAMVDNLRAGKLGDPSLIEKSDLIFVQEIGEILTLIQAQFPSHFHKVRRFPFIHFPAFHPDIVYVSSRKHGNQIQGPLGEYQSAIALCGWMEGLSIDETVGLFRHEIYEALGYYSYWETSRKLMIDVGQGADFPINELLEKWCRRGCWLYSINHPKPFVLADIVRQLLSREGIATLPDVEDFVADGFVMGPAWPVYPEIGKALGLPGHYNFKAIQGYGTVEKPILMLCLEEFVARSFDVFARYGRDDLKCERLSLPRYQDLKRFAGSHIEVSTEPTVTPSGSPSSPASTTNPYAALPDHQFWRRAMENVSPENVDPVVRAKFRVSRQDKVATAGSCFAQHISASLAAQGFNYYIAENAAHLPPEMAASRQYGVFSARYGNLYTARQLVQLFDRAYGQFVPIDDHWVRADGRLVDAFRPQVEPDGFASLDELAQARSQHFAAVREMFETLDVFVFTLGLTEAWRSRIDGAVYPLAPGVVAGRMDAARHEFVNFDVNAVISDMRSFVERLRKINPAARMIVTVSPVPLIATFEARHVLVSTTLSKAVLRTAADEITRNDALSDYFPSYEIITGNHARGGYFESDLRSVAPAGVRHVMRLFFAHFATTENVSTSLAPSASSASSALSAEISHESATVREIVCDEEAIDKGQA